jgi:hypothetical protein
MMVEDSLGNVFVTNDNNFSQIWKITPLGVLTVFAVTPSLARWMAIDSNDNLFITTSTNVYKVSSSGSITYLYNSTGLQGIVTDSSNNVFFLRIDTNNNSIIHKITPSGVETTFVNLFSIGTIPLLLIDSSNNLYFIDQAQQKVGKITPSGTITRYGNGVSANGGGIQLPNIQMVIDSSGNIFNNNWQAQRVYKTTPLGVTTFYSLSSRPFSLSIDSNDNIYASMYDNTITKITPSGTITTLGSSGQNPYGTLVYSSGDKLYIANNSGGNVTTLPI